MMIRDRSNHAASLQLIHALRSMYIRSSKWTNLYQKSGAIPLLRLEREKDLLCCITATKEQFFNRDLSAPKPASEKQRNSNLQFANKQRCKTATFATTGSYVRRRIRSLAARKDAVCRQAVIRLQCLHVSPLQRNNSEMAEQAPVYMPERATGKKGVSREHPALPENSAVGTHKV